MRLKHFLDIRFTLCSTFSWSSPGFHTNSSYELCLLALSLCLQWHASAFPLLRYRVCVRERDREHVALKSFLSYSPLREKSSNRERERERERERANFPSHSWTFPRLECWNGSPLILWMSLHNCGVYAQEGSLKWFDWACVCEVCVWQERAWSYVRCYTERFWETRILLQTPGSNEATETAQPLQE